MQEVLRIWTLRPADALDRSSVNRRLAAFDTEDRLGRLKAGEQDCRLFTTKRIPCRGFDLSPINTPGMYLVSKFFEALPVERYPLLDPGEGPLGYKYRKPLEVRQTVLIGGEALRPAYGRINRSNPPGIGMELGLSLVPAEVTTGGMAL